MPKTKNLKDLDRVMVITTRNGKTYNSRPFQINKENKDYIVKQCLEITLSEFNIAPADVLNSYTIRVKESDEFYISDHAYDRMKERCGWNKKASARMFEKVLKDGIRKDGLTGYLRRWIEYREERAAEASHDASLKYEALVYGEYVFLICNRVLVTVFSVPTKQRIIAILNHRNNVGEEAI